WTLVDGGRHTADATGAGQTIRLRTDLALGVEGNRIRARHVLTAGDECYCALSWAEGLTAPDDVTEASRRIDATTRFWRNWLGRARMPDHRWSDAIQRSALTIKGLTYLPTGATVAALTTSLPETPGGERNWDYRYTWMRDTTFTLQALHYLNLDWEADEFMQFVADLEPNQDGALQIMYGIDGRRDLTESTRDDLSGYAGARPVRIGNGAFDQRQNDVFGAVLDSVLLHTRRSARLPRRLWPIVQSQAQCATAVWREPDQGIWEARGKPQHYVSSKLMGWVALDRASKLAHIRGDQGLAASWRETAEEIKADILAHGIDGRRDLTESTRDDLSGYAGARPVRIGNGAFDQRQNDVFGAVLDSVLLHTRRSARLPRRLWPIVQSQAQCATAVWREPDQGIWEARGKPQHYVSSKLMGWVALDRASKLAQIRGDQGLAASWRETAEEIKADILAHGIDNRGVLRQHYDTDALDASTLLAAIFGFLPRDDKRLRASVLAVADELTENGFVLRYRTNETDDGLSGKEGTFLICSFWLVSALAIIGEEQRARDLMERLLRIASPLGLLAEEFDVDTGRHLGNFPQAFSHLALIEAAARIITAERLAEYSF
ncbi:MAG TPA: glycoside hydrolase family 15 protein, partial [Propionibacteriaceae bacterium]|nr:glycoside hydrolase family 15 protein [Propionibacteriaceae bacterium]